MSDWPGNCEVCGRPVWPSKSGRGPDYWECDNMNGVECQQARDLVYLRSRLERAEGLLRRWQVSYPIPGSLRDDTLAFLAPTPPEPPPAARYCICPEAGGVYHPECPVHSLDRPAAAVPLKEPPACKTCPHAQHEGPCGVFDVAFQPRNTCPCYVATRTPEVTR